MNTDTEKFDLHRIFPKLESFMLIGDVNDKNFMANVKNLKELTLRSETIEDYQFENIFGNNKEIWKLTASPKKSETLGSIENHLKKLEILEFRHVGREVLIRSNFRRTYKLATVTSFTIRFVTSSDLIGDLSFSMPNLKRLHLEVYNKIDSQLSDFINRFENLETVEIKDSRLGDITECLNGLSHVKEVTAGLFNLEMPTLIRFFEQFDKSTSPLNTIKFKHLDYGYTRSMRENCISEMRKTNAILKKSNKSTWIVYYDKKESSLVFKLEQ